VLTVKQVAEVLGVEPITVYRLIDRGELKAIRIGTCNLRVEREELTAYVARNRTDSHFAQAGMTGILAVGRKYQEERQNAAREIDRTVD
jgi:excisionase family DNA binding protein